MARPTPRVSISVWSRSHSTSRRGAGRQVDAADMSAVCHRSRLVTGATSGDRCAGACRSRGQSPAAGGRGRLELGDGVGSFAGFAEAGVNAGLQCLQVGGTGRAVGTAESVTSDDSQLQWFPGRWRTPHGLPRPARDRPCPWGVAWWRPGWQAASRGWGLSRRRRPTGQYAGNCVGGSLRVLTGEPVTGSLTLTPGFRATQHYPAPPAGHAPAAVS
jgi:hypothetical protein